MKRTAIISFMFLAILSLSGCSLLIDGTHGRTYVSTGTWVDCYNCGYTEYYVSPPPPPRPGMHRPPPPKHWNGSHHPKHNFKNGSHRPPKHGFKVGNNRPPMQHSGRGRR